MNARWLYAASVAALALTSSAALAQGRGHGRGHDRDNPPPGQVKKAEREDAARFRDQDRDYARNWYYHENRGDRDRLPPGLRDRDRLPPGIERQLRPGWIVEPAYRQQLYPVPVVLVRRFAPPPEGFRYVIFGGRVLLVDPGYRVVDMLQLNINLGN